MVKFSYTRFGKWGCTTVLEKGPVVYDPEMMSCEPLCDGDVKKRHRNTVMGGAECLYQWTAVSLRGTLPERGSVFLY